MATVDPAVISAPRRLAAVDRARQVLPSLPMPLDRIARYAARCVDAPMCAVTFVGQLEHHFAGAHGVCPTLVARRCLPLSHSVCKYVVSADHPVCSDDMLADDDLRMREHPLAVEYGIRAFLGVPLRDTDDQPIGALTVLDTAPRAWSPAQVSALVEIAELLGPVPVEPAAPALAVAALDSASLLDSVQEAFVAVDPDAVVVGFNRAAQDMLGWAAAEVCGRPIADTVFPDYHGEPTGEALARLRLAPPGLRIREHMTVRHGDGRLVPAAVSLSMVRGSAGALLCAFITDATAAG